MKKVVIALLILGLVVSAGVVEHFYIEKTFDTLDQKLYEIEDALHPLTIVDFLKVARERNIQLIFSSHNTYILQLLRPDQIFFANWKEGYSSYKRLSEIYPNIREINNIEKMYLSHLFDEDIKKND